MGIPDLLVLHGHPQPDEQLPGSSVPQSSLHWKSLGPRSLSCQHLGPSQAPSNSSSTWFEWNRGSLSSLGFSHLASPRTKDCNLGHNTRNSRFMGFSCRCDLPGPDKQLFRKPSIVTHSLWYSRRHPALTKVDPKTWLGAHRQHAPW